MLCPSASETMENPTVVGFVDASAGKATIGYLKIPVTANSELLALAGPYPTQVFRLAAACMKERCVHQAEGKCSLVTRVVEVLAKVTQKIPPCSIRAKCVWWDERGADACLRCPQIITTNHQPSDAERIAAGPSAEFKLPPDTP